MSGQLDVAPTQGNLLHIQSELEQVQNGHDLLDRKREVLIQRLTEAIAEAERAQQEARDRFRQAHDALRRARMQLGTRQVQEISLNPTAELAVHVDTHSIMGARVPIINIEVSQPTVAYGPDDTSATLDQARQLWLEAVRYLGELTEKVATVWRLALELRKTQRRVNALETIIIPQYQNTVNFIEQMLAEASREDIIRTKKVKAMRQK
jgi:V/A-type H+-transporting ATPase subunit D